MNIVYSQFISNQELFALMMEIVFNMIFTFLVVFVFINDNNVDASSTKKVTGWENVFSANFSSSLQLQHFGNKTYYLGTYLKASFIQASQICQSVHMTLVSVESLQENDRLYKYVKDANRGDEFWSSGSKLLDGKHWKWLSNGNDVEFTKWATGQPDSQVEHCLLLVHLKNNGLFWHDKDCNSQFWFICERRDDEIYSESYNQVTVWNNQFLYPVSWSSVDLMRYEDKSYYFSRYFKGTFLQARQFCEMIGMNALTIRSEKENSRLHKYIRDTNAGNDWWCSGTRFVDGRSWIWSSSGEEVDYTNWLTGQPDNINQLCLRLTDQKNTGLFWDDQDCNVQYPVICDKWHGDAESEIKGVKDKLIDVRLNDADNEIDDDSNRLLKMRKTPPPYIENENIEGRSVKIYIENRVTQEEAAQLCNHHKMQLLSIENEEKNKFIRRLLEKNNAMGPFWTSGRKSHGVWLWHSTGKPLSFYNWSGGFDTDNTCISIGKGGGWIKKNCNLDYIGFICEISDVVPSSQCSVKPIVNVYVQNEVVTAAEKRVSDDFSIYENVTAQ